MSTKQIEEMLQRLTALETQMKFLIKGMWLIAGSIISYTIVRVLPLASKLLAGG